MAIHGILTGRSEPTWPETLDAWLSLIDPDIRVGTDWYFELPLPRLAARRNGKRVSRLMARIDERVDLRNSFGLERPVLSIVGHSNGGQLAMLLAAALIERGWKIEGILLMAPAVRAPWATRLISNWIANGDLEKALLVRPLADKTIGFVGAVPNIVCWPWGALGRDGWDRGEIHPKALESVHTLDLPNEGHSGITAKDRRLETFSEIIGPFLGLPTATPDYE